MHQEKYKKKDSALMWKEDISIKLTKNFTYQRKEERLKT